ncbi:peptidylprolyl isomerase [Patescibacteria group bacterium]|nr:peptidylprolyl isomerase [Patescibacteria group bacterium]MBU1016234.1 peptidylprolyl isomerase [Patescibacteria group bacterium]
MKTLFSIFLASGILLLAGCTPKSPEAEIGKVYQGSPETFNANKDTVMSTFSQTAMPEAGEQIVVMETGKGTIKIQLFPEYAPKTVENFVGLIEKGYYDGLIFHRVIPDFMIQGGDPLGTGRGGESVWGGKFEDEFSPNLKNLRGSLSMANSGPNTNGSQFFIVQKEGGTPWLDSRHSVFGQVIEGMEVVDTIANAPRDAADKPLEDVVMTKVTLGTYE